MAFSATGCQKLGQPVPESNFVLRARTTRPRSRHRRTSRGNGRVAYLPEKAGSVALSRVTMKTARGRTLCHSRSDLRTNSGGRLGLLRGLLVRGGPYSAAFSATWNGSWAAGCPRGLRRILRRRDRDGQ